MGQIRDLQGRVDRPSYSIGQRLRFFKSIVQPSVLYGCVSWTLTQEREKLLRTTQRKMLRRIINTKRKVRHRDGDEHVLEDWVDWVRRATRDAEKYMTQYCIPDWIHEVRKRQFQWAGHVCRRTDGRWTKQVLGWTPVGQRAVGRPLTRWSDAVNKFFDHLGAATDCHINWMSAAQDRGYWKQLEEHFLEFCLR